MMAANGMKVMTTPVVPMKVMIGPIQQQTLLLMKLGKCLYGLRLIELKIYLIAKLMNNSP